MKREFGGGGGGVDYTGATQSTRCRTICKRGKVGRGLARRGLRIGAAFSPNFHDFFQARL